MAAMNNARQLILSFGLALLLLGVLSRPAMAGAYADSAHGTKVTRTVTAAAGYPVGSCAHCHEQHASVDGAEHTPNNNLMFTDLTGDAFCNSCHNGSETVKDIATNWNNGDFGHGVRGAGMVCADCHDPHFSNPVHSAAAHQNWVQPPGGGTYGSIVGTVGVEPSWPVVGDPAPDSAIPESVLAPTSFTLKDPIEYEYQLCFKCHSDPNVNPYNPMSESDMTNGTGDLTLVAAQFNPNQYSHHPVTGTGNWRNPNALVGLKEPWASNPNARMYCTDCHGDPVSGAAGSHASNAKYMLKASGSPLNPSAPDCYDNLCLICHNDQYNGGGKALSSPWSHGSNAAHQYEGEGNGENRLGCTACHGGPAGFADFWACGGQDNGGKMGAIHGEKFKWQGIYPEARRGGGCDTTANVTHSNAEKFLVGGYLNGIVLDGSGGTCWGTMTGTDGCSSMGAAGKGW